MSSGGDQDVIPVHGEDRAKGAKGPLGPKDRIFRIWLRTLASALPLISKQEEDTRGEEMRSRENVRS